MSAVGALSLLLALGANEVEVLRDGGSPSNRIDVVILGDGYRAQDQAQLTSDATNVVNQLFAATPWKEYESLFNVSLVHVVSNENGADNGTYGATRDTALGAYYNCSGIDRALCINYGLVYSAANAAVPTYDFIVVVVNDPKYGGTGGSVATLSIHSLAPEILIHEMGHTIGKLADEYTDAYPAYPSCSGDCPEANATLNATATVKWSKWVDATTPVPTPTGSGYSAKVGVFEGCRYKTTGVYRPFEHNCRMDILGVPFCSVCSEGQVLKFANLVSFFDSHTPAGPTAVSACAQATFSVTPLVLDGSPLAYAWTVNGVAQSAGTSLTVDATSNLTVTVAATHTTALVRNDPSKLLTDTLTFPLVTSTPCDGNCVAGACVPVVWANVANVVVEATGPTGAVASFAPTATQGATALTVTCVPASGSTFGVSATPVTCTAAGGSTRTFSVTVSDTGAPTLTLPANQTAEATSGSGAAVTFTASASDLVDGARVVTCTPASGATFPVGTTTVSCHASDTHSNMATGSFTVTVQDTMAPTLMLPADKSVDVMGPVGVVVTFVVSATDTVDGSVAVTCSKTAGQIFAVGTTTVTCTASDAHSNVASGTFKVTVRDTTAPTIVLPADVTVEATSSAGAVATFTVTATDAAHAPVAVTCVPASGSTFSLGVTHVSCTAGTSTSELLVTVRDTTAPVVTCPANVAALETGAMTNVSFAGAVAVDAVTAATVTYSPASGSAFARGVTHVTVTATDVAGNSATCDFVVDVEDHLVTFDAGTGAASDGGTAIRPDAGVVGRCGCTESTNGSLGLWALVAMALVIRSRSRAKQG